MKKRFSLSRVMHNERLMMLVSLLLAILIWSLVVFGPSNTQEHVISGVPISVTLNDYANQTLNLRVVSGANATATVKVRGLRSVVSRLSASDITITADTGNVIKEGTYTLPLRVVSNGDYTIQSVVGPDGNNDTVTITCDAWREAFFPVTVQMPNLKVADTKNYQIGTPIVSNSVLKDGFITLAGPRTDINRVDAVTAVISDEAELTESGVYTAKLEARDQAGVLIESVSFVNAEDGTVSVTVPVLVYREVTLSPTVLNAPEGYANASSLVTVSPSKIELWGVPSEIDDYVAAVQEQLTVDFDHLNATNLKREINLTATESIRPVNGEEKVSLNVNIYNVISKTFEVTISNKNFVAQGVTSGYKVVAKQTKLSVTLCGPAYALNAVKTSDIRAVANVTQGATGLQTVYVRVEVPGKTTVWPCYEDGKNGVEMLVSVDNE
ncbi:MAG: hypothetical protein IJB26_06635 [Clostridia bacterium]|nr:hypothetical protein [Clostridia bacterium]